MRNQESGKSTFATMAVLFAVASLALVATHGDASACGGLFCNARPPDPFAPLPVAQNGENVVFSITKYPAGGAPTLQAHIQILYTGDAAKFSWVVPVDAAPSCRRERTAFSRSWPRHRAALHDQPVIEGNCIPQPITGQRGRRLIRDGSGGHHGLRGQHRSRRRRQRHGQLPGRGRAVRRGRDQVRRFDDAEDVADRQRLHHQ